MIAAAEFQSDEPVDLEALEQRVVLRLAEGATVKTIVSELCDEVGLPRRELYAFVQGLRADEPDPE